MPELFATCPRGIEDLLAAELRALSASEVSPRRAGVAFSGSLETAYRACLWSRTANRVLLPIGSFAAPDEHALYDGVRTIRWREHLTARQTLAVDFTSVQSQLEHTHYGALKTKDAIVDQLRDETGARPSIDRARPDVRVHVHVDGERAIAYIDLSGESLHRRGWREAGAQAPLKENLAAAVLLLAGWPERARAREPLIDPMCGSGTLPIEAALMAMDRAPGLDRDYFGFTGWLGHQPLVWEALLADARSRVIEDPRALPIIRGFDEDPQAIKVALANLARARLTKHVHLERRALDALEPIGERPGIVVTNPPYGERIGEAEALEPLYRQLGDRLRRRFPGWTGFVLTGNLELGKRIGLRAQRKHILYNGAIECRLYELPISSEPVADESGPRWRKPRPPGPGADMFGNRLAKNLKHLRKWAKREGVTCFRVYDADLPEYSVAVDLYEDAAHIQEYACPPTVDATKAEQRLHDVMAVAPEVLGVQPDDVYLKVRKRQRGLDQYEKLGDKRAERRVHEGGHTFLVNLSDYLDTGLFLDHRRLRQMIGELAKGRRFLNLFAYTCTATVYAAKGGARGSVSVDLSNTYLDWAQRNFAENRLGPEHRLERADVLEWLPRQNKPGDRYGLILVAPPTFSNSKRMEDTFDVQRDHVLLLKSAASLLEPDGVLLFSNNFRRFKMDAAALPGLRIDNISAKTLPEDFKRDPRIHNTWRLTSG
jgi:23S rRNA (guanine2445-N2)-methyltransferase / 23S rRNA (guanine2069-N7)-methyltransferase